MHMVKEVRSNREYTERTIQTARWARDQIKRQTGESIFHSVYRTAGNRPYVDSAIVDSDSPFSNNFQLYGDS